jgi:hypothetical protein
MKRNKQKQIELERLFESEGIPRADAKQAAADAILRKHPDEVDQIMLSLRASALRRRNRQG